MTQLPRVHTPCVSPGVLALARRQPPAAPQRRRRVLGTTIICGVAVGIDLGTSNSAVAIIRDGVPTVVPDEGGAYILPSAVSFDASGEALVGAAALARAVTHTQDTFTSVKRLIGRRATDVVADAARCQYVVGDDGTGAAALYCPALGRWLSPEQVSAVILRELVERAQRYAGDSVDAAVITVPAHFGEARRAATMRAARAAGLERVQLLQEPVAAALAHGVGTGGCADVVLVLDLGGGTFDVSLVDSFEGILEVLSTGGDSWLGGDDWDAALVTWLLADVVPRDAVPSVRSNPKAMAQLLAAARAAKLALTDEPTARIHVPDLSVSTELTRSQLEQLTAPVLQRVLPPLEALAAETFLEWAERPAYVLGQDAAAPPADDVAAVHDPYAPPPRRITQAVVVGGAARMPAVRELVQRMTGLQPCGGVDPELCVALGAAAQAGMLLGQLRGLEVMDGGYDAALHDRTSGFVGSA